MLQKREQAPKCGSNEEGKKKGPEYLDRKRKQLVCIESNIFLCHPTGWTSHIVMKGLKLSRPLKLKKSSGATSRVGYLHISDVSWTISVLITRPS
jgi:hypothetical protein